ncbi:MAG: WD40 repeat domain-containing protein [Nostoc sp.]|uniref:WD40 repeat domain-containing protein n=1 Tax=Nostoc sp. TaxID=1180 RepID=UPI002FF486F5
MSENQPKEYDAVLGRQVPPPVDGLVLGGIEGFKKRLASISLEQRMVALEDALKYGEAGLELLIQTLTDVSPQIQQTAENLLFQHRTKPRVKQALCEYNPWLLFECLQTISGHTDRVNTVAINPDGQTFVSGGGVEFVNENGEVVKLWDLKTGHLLKTLVGHFSYIKSVVFNPDGQSVFTSCHETIKLWNLQTGTQEDIITFATYANEVESPARIRLFPMSGGIDRFAISPDGHLLACRITYQQLILVCDLQTQQQLRTLKKPNHGAYSHCLAITPNKQILVDANGSSRIDIWNLETGELIRTLKAHSQRVNSIAISPDGETLVSGDNNSIIKVWSLLTGEETFTINAQSGSILCVSISPDGQNLISSCGDCTIKVWDLQTGRGKAIFNGHTAAVGSVAISTDGQTLVSGSVDGTIKIWRMP